MWICIGLTLLLAASLPQGDTSEECHLSEELIKEIRGYQPVVNKIIDLVVHGRMKGQVYSALADFIYRFGGRLAGSFKLERSIDYLVKNISSQGLNVETQAVRVPRWVRGKESATLILPRKKKLVIVGLGKSIGTPPKGITAPVLVVKSFKELKRRSKEAAGKIIVFAQKWRGYRKTRIYRNRGATQAAKFGGVAALTRALTDHSLQTPHTGSQGYKKNIKKIPVASISVEDSEFLLQLQKAGKKIVVNLKMGARNLPDVISRNVIVNVGGREKPKEYVMVSGHIDSWDTGEGAMDDGGGMAISWFVPVVLKELGLQPRRSLRTVLFTSEEIGLVGAKQYKRAHNDDEIVLAMESDEGVFNPTGLEMRGSKEALCTVGAILQLLAPINATILEPVSSAGSDITIWNKTPVPTAALRNDNGKYFWYHHTPADTMSVLNSNDMDKCLALWSAASFVIADLRERLPRENKTFKPKVIQPSGSPKQGNSPKNPSTGSKEQRKDPAKKTVEEALSPSAFDLLPTNPGFDSILSQFKNSEN